MSRKLLKLSLILIALVFLTSACSWPGRKKVAPLTIKSSPNTNNPKLVATSSPKIVYSNKLKKFKNASELIKFLNNNSDRVSNYFGSGLNSNNNTNTNNIPNNYLGISPALKTAAKLTKPNILEIKGNYIYVLAGNELSIIKLVPVDQAKLVSKIVFKSRPQAILLSGNFLAVYGLDTQLNKQAIYKTFRRKNAYTFFKVFDISDPAKPKVTRDLDFEGTYNKARLINGQVYFLTNTPGTYLSGEPVLPRVIDNGQVLTTNCAGALKCFAPELYYFDIPYNSYHFVSVNIINLKDNTTALSGQVYLVNKQQKFYLMPDSLDITYSPTPNYYNLERQVKRSLVYPKLNPENKNKIIKIDTISSSILNNNEKQIKVAEIINSYLNSLGVKERKNWQTIIASSTKQKLINTSKSLDKTFIYKWAIKNNSLIYRAFGQLRGTVLGSSALDQAGDYLRIVTTSSPWSLNLNKFTNSYYTNVYILGPNLKIVGSLENLMTTEQIYKVRFLGNRLYLITLKAQDPLFIIDLNDPTKPSVLGAIQIPGLTNYLQPLNSNGTKLIVLSRKGKIVYNDGTNAQGLASFLFDFSSLSKPKELSSYLISASGGTSMALENHQTMFYSPDDNLLVIPATLHNDKGRLTFVGALVFKLVGDKLSLQGKIDHSQGAYFSPADSWGGFNYYDDTVQRSLVFNNNLITFSNKFLKINSLSDLKPLASIELTTAGDNYMIRPFRAGNSSTTKININTASSTKATTSSSNFINPVSSTTPLDQPGATPLDQASTSPLKQLNITPTSTNSLKP